MKVAYQDIAFSASKLAIIDRVNDIVDAYEAEGYNLTLRQVYYQFVARDWFPDDRTWTEINGKWVRDPNGTKNAEPNYKWLGVIINDARLGGMISWKAIEDRTRELTSNSHWDNPEDIVYGAAKQYAIDKWEDQPYRVEIWVEKDALEGVIARPAKEHDVSYFSCRGYTSQTAMHDAAMRLQQYIRNGQDAIILHLGDHDPSGIDMSRDIEDRLRLFLGNDSDGLEMRRIALNMNQIRQYNPPPNPAKITDSRARGYIDIFGNKSWELDALEPRVINKLVSDNILSIVDDGKYSIKQSIENEQRELLTAISDRLDDVSEFLKNH